MACVWSISLFLLSCLYFVKADECVVYDFENNAHVLFGNEKALCTGMETWTVGNYSEIGVESPNPDSGTFVTPSSTISCGASFDFTMSSGGIVEVNVFMDSAVVTDYVTVIVSQVIPDGNDAVVGSIVHSAFMPDFANGWQTLRMTLAATGTFKGYINFLGMTSEGSSILIDSFRYIPPTVDERSCNIYADEIIETTTEKQDTTTERSDGIKDCVTYNFETDFEIRFSTDNYLCDGFVSWHLDNYTSIDIDSPSPQSTVFMTPNEAPSCISSFVFKMAPDGIIEANIFMEPVTAVDHIIVLAQKVTEKEYDTVAGFKMYYPENHVFVTGWNVLRFTLLDFTSFEGYLIFIGSADKGSTVLVDSVRYIPPLTPPDDASCSLY